MPKVPFRVVHNTGWEDEYPATDLEVHSPFVKGWRSPRYCLYPQQIIIKIDPLARIRKIQVLSHHCLIASMIELYVGHYTTENHMSLEHTKFTRLGYISLSDNKSNNYKCMELKSVNVDCMGELIKLVLYQNHINPVNLYNQVGIVAVNIIADPVLTDRHMSRPELPEGMLDMIRKSTSDAKLATLLSTYLPGVNQPQVGSTNPVLKGRIKPPRVAPMDDLAFVVGQDPETADIVRKLERRKMSAIEEENYPEAKRLKMVMDELCKAGEMLCKYEVAKKEAIAREDFDTAKEKKDKIDEARKLIYKELGLHGLLSGGKRPTISTNPPHVRSRQSGRSRHSSGPENTSTSSQGVVEERRSGSPLLPPIHQPSKSTAPTPTPEKATTTLPPILRDSRASGTRPADDRPLPTLAKRFGTEEAAALPRDPAALPRDPEEEEAEGREEIDGEREGSEGGGEEEREEEIIKTEPLSEKQQNMVSLAVDYFGMEVLEQLYAKQFSVRERSLNGVHRVLSSKDRLSRREMSTLLKGICQILVKGFKDEVFSTFSQTRKLLQYILGPFAQKHNMSNQDITHMVEKVVPILLTRTGDFNPRIREVVQDLLTELIRHEKIRELTLFGPILIEPFKAKTPSWHLIVSRVTLLERLKEDPGFTASSGLNVKKVMQFIVTYLEHSNSEVRDAVIRLILVLYSMNGTEVRALMPVADNATFRKKTLWKTVFEGFDKIDGVPSPAEREALNKAAQNAKNEEILKLQKQVQTMRNLVPSANNAETRNNAETGSRLGTGLEGTLGAGENDTIDKMCVFCGKQQEALQSEEAMEQHYLEECPMLQSCSHCHQVIEISGLANHWLTECEAKANFRQCPLCKDSVLVQEFDDHIEAGDCRGGSGGKESSRCPLCHQNIPQGDEGWRTHLMGPKGHSSTCQPQKESQNKLSVEEQHQSRHEVAPS